MGTVTLILDRSLNELLIRLGKGDLAVLDDVTGLERYASRAFEGVRIIRRGEEVGAVFYVKEIKEKW